MAAAVEVACCRNCDVVPLTGASRDVAGVLVENVTLPYGS